MIEFSNSAHFVFDQVLFYTMYNHVIDQKVYWVFLHVNVYIVHVYIIARDVLFYFSFYISTVLI